MLKISSKLKSKIEYILKNEGGYVDDPDDSGGETNFGITKKTALACGYKGEMCELTLNKAIEIYYQKYWIDAGFDKIKDDTLALVMFDLGVNMGPRRPIRFFQIALNVLNNRQKLYDDIKEDGVIGKATVKAYIEYISHRGNNGVYVLRSNFIGQATVYYNELVQRREKDEKFIYGWVSNRILQNTLLLLKGA